MKGKTNRISKYNPINFYNFFFFIVLIILAAVAITSSFASDFRCPDTGVSFFPHEESCSKFIMCFGGLALERTCAPNLHWSAGGEYCTTHAQAECELENPLCPEVDDPNDLIFIPSLADCEKYYLCHQGEPKQFRCAPNFHFNPVENFCDYPELANCEVEPTPDPETEPGEIEIECPETGIFWFPHPYSCEYYFICLNGESVLHHCAPGLYWDAANNRCDFPENALCELTPIPQPL